MRNDSRPLGEHSPASPLGGGYEPMANRHDDPRQRRDANDLIAGEDAGPEPDGGEPAEPGDSRRTRNAGSSGTA